MSRLCDVNATNCLRCEYPLVLRPTGTGPLPFRGKERAENTPPRVLSITALSGLASRVRHGSTSSEAFDTFRWRIPHLASIGRCAFEDRAAFSLTNPELCSCCWPPRLRVHPENWGGPRTGPPGLLATARWSGTSRRCRRAEPRTRFPGWNAATAPPGFRSRVPVLPLRPVRHGRPAR